MDEAPTSSRDLGLEAYSRIRAAIRGGSLTPGERLTETDLAARFGVSRTPVRQAIARLEAEGPQRWSRQVAGLEEAFIYLMAGSTDNFAGARP